MNKPFIFLSILLASFAAVGEPTDEIVLLREIRATVIEICDAPSMKGSTTTLGANLEAQASVSKLLKKIADLKVGGKLQGTYENYSGLSQSDLKDVVIDNKLCRRDLTRVLSEKLLGKKISASGRSSTRQNWVKPTQSGSEFATAWLELLDQEKFIDGYAALTPDVKNAVGVVDWQKEVKRQRSRGAMVERSYVTARPLDDGAQSREVKYTLVIYRTKWERTGSVNGIAGDEFVKVALSPGGGWKVAVYECICN